MAKTLTTPSNSLQPQSKDSEFEFEKYPIGAEAIAAEVERLVTLGNEAKGKQINRFPVEAFPEPVQQIILETNANLNFPIDFIGASLLYAVS